MLEPDVSKVKLSLSLACRRRLGPTHAAAPSRRNVVQPPTPLFTSSCCLSMKGGCVFRSDAWEWVEPPDRLAAARTSAHYLLRQDKLRDWLMRVAAR